MKTLKIKVWNEEDMKYNENQLKRYGYTKTNDCMWVKIYTKENSEVILEK